MVYYSDQRNYKKERKPWLENGMMIKLIKIKFYKCLFLLLIHYKVASSGDAMHLLSCLFMLFCAVGLKQYLH